MKTNPVIIFVLLLITNPWNIVYVSHDLIQTYNGQYLNYFSPRFLAFDGSWLLGNGFPPYVGVLLFPSIIFLVLGFFLSFSKKITIPKIFFLLLFLVAPLLNKSILLSIPLLYFTTKGIYYCTNYLRKFPKIVKFITYFILISAYLFSFLYFLDLYIYHTHAIF